MAQCSDGNGGRTPIHIERRDFLKLGGFVLAVIGSTLGIAVPLMMYVFQTNGDAAEALAERIAKETEIETAAKLHEQEARLLRTADRRDVQDVKMIAKTTDDNLRALMKDLAVPKRQIKPMPAGITFDAIQDP
jgi:hypothetical protein